MTWAVIICCLWNDWQMIWGEAKCFLSGSMAGTRQDRNPVQASTRPANGGGEPEEREHGARLPPRREFFGQSPVFRSTGGSHSPVHRDGQHGTRIFGGL